MRLEEMNWMDVESYLEQDDRILLITGSCEQHGYLSLLTDIKIPMALADAASKKSGVLVAPPLNFGVSPYYLAYPGTISLRQSVFLDVLRDVVASLYRAGFRRMLVVNGHGGNEAGSNTLVELMNEFDGLKTAWYSWWESQSVTAVARKYNLRVAHAGWIEAFPFTMVEELPQEPKAPVQQKGLLSARGVRALHGDGVSGGPYQVSPEIMDEIFAAALADILFELEF